MFVRRKTADHVFADRLVFDPGNEILDDLQPDIGFQQCDAHFPQRPGCWRRSDVLSAQRLDDGSQPAGELSNICGISNVIGMRML
jgi:hypothetical protein